MIEPHLRLWARPLGIVFVTCASLSCVRNAQAQPVETVTVETLRNELAKRDAMIIDLLHRVRDLEAQRASGPDKMASTKDGMQGREPIASSVTADERSSDSGSAGRLPVTELAAERALERSLIQDGVILLTPGRVEIAPTTKYSRFESSYPTVLTLGAENFVGNVLQRTNVLDSNVGFKAGLPHRAQVELSIPYRMIDQHGTASINSTPQFASSRSGTGFGDIRIGVATQLTTQKSWWPNVIGRVTWSTGSGKYQDNQVALGAGTSALSTRVAAYWRSDPAIFLLGGGYTHYLPDNRIRPGDAFDISLGMALAVNPDTALTFALDQTFFGTYSFNGTSAPGTERLSSVFDVSATTIIGPGRYLRVSAGLGLTDNAPDYQVGVSLPFGLCARYCW